MTYNWNDANIENYLCPLEKKVEGMRVECELNSCTQQRKPLLSSPHHKCYLTGLLLFF